MWHLNLLNLWHLFLFLVRLWIFIYLLPLFIYSYQIQSTIIVFKNGCWNFPGSDPCNFPSTCWSFPSLWLCGNLYTFWQCPITYFFCKLHLYFNVLSFLFFLCFSFKVLIDFIGMFESIYICADGVLDRFAADNIGIYTRNHICTLCTCWIVA